MIIMKYIFLHGLGQTALSWEKTISVMDKKMDINCLDLFALLRNKEINYSNLYQAFSEYCDVFSEPFCLCGLSLGGILALQYGIENPDKISSMALIGTQYNMPKKMLKFQNTIFRIMPNGIFKKMGLEKKDAISLSKSMMDLDFQQNLQKIECPALIVCGEKDKANMQASLQLEKLMPNARLNIIKNAGHEINVDAPKDLGMVLNKFFNNNSQFPV